MLVFVPVSVDELRAWAGAGVLTPIAAFAVTAAMRAGFGFAADDDEEAEHTALHIAGLAGLLRGERRLVAVVSAAARPVPDGEFGEVTVQALPWAAVTALFAEDAPQSAARLHHRLAGSTLATAWDDAEVEAFLSEHELLWHGPGEWAALT